MILFIRGDMIDLMVDAIKEDKKASLDEEVIVATALIILIAGYDTTSATLSYCAYELVKNPEVQQKLRDEVRIF